MLGYLTIIFWQGFGCTPALTKDFLKGWNSLTYTSPALMVSAMVLRTWSFSKWPLSMCSKLPRLERKAHVHISAMPYLCRFDGLGSTSYNACTRYSMRWGLAFHSPVQITFLSTAFTYLVQVPCCFIPTTFHVLISSTVALTLPWTKQDPPLLLVFVCGIGKEPSAGLPCLTTPTCLLCGVALPLASWTASSALHFLTVLTWIPDLAPFVSQMFLSWTTSLNLVTLNFSSNDLKGSCIPEYIHTQTDELHERSL